MAKGGCGGSSSGGAWKGCAGAEHDSNSNSAPQSHALAPSGNPPLPTRPRTLLLQSYHQYCNSGRQFARIKPAFGCKSVLWCAEAASRCSKRFGST